MKIWLKFLCVALLLYSGIFSLWHPMIPGGFGVATTTLKPGRNEFVFTGYNCHFVAEQPTLQLLVNAGGKTYYCAQVLEIKSNNVVKAAVVLPDTIASNEFSFYANTDVDGTVFVEAPTTSEGFVLDKNARALACDYHVKTNAHSGFGFPFQPIIIESIRNLMWHVPMWFTMFVLMGISFFYSIRALGQAPHNALSLDSHFSGILLHDLRASAAAATGLVFCVLGLITGSVWARFTWGTWWVNDPQLNGALAVFMVYAAYFILRKSVPDEEKLARLSAIFNIFALVLMVVLLMVMPRFTDGLHPGKSGNPAFSKYDLDSSLRTVFYPACAGFILLGYWIYSLNFRISKLESEHEQNA